MIYDKLMDFWMYNPGKKMTLAAKCAPMSYVLNQDRIAAFGLVEKL